MRIPETHDREKPHEWDPAHCTTPTVTYDYMCRRPGMEGHWRKLFETWTDRRHPGERLGCWTWEQVP